MFIHSCGRFIGHPADDIDHYKQAVKDYTDLRFRRANRFVLLSLAGACRCVHQHRIDKETGVYLTTENGNLGDTDAVLDQIFHQHQFPMPYNFINTMSNTASFYVAQNLNLFGRNLTFSSRQLSFERGIELLCSDMACGAVSEALIGGVDEACLSKRNFEAKYRRPYDSLRMIEASSWFLIKAEKGAALGQISPPESFPDFSCALSALKRKSFSRPVVVSYGLLLDGREREGVARALADATIFDHLAAQGYHDSATACGLAGFFERFESTTWVHINKDLRGRVALLVAEKY